MSGLPPRVGSGCPVGPSVPVLTATVVVAAVVALATLAVLAVALAAVATGADPTVAPSPTPDLLLQSGDLRSEGEGPGLVGNPLLILGAVVLLGLATALTTVLAVRVLERR